MEYSISIDLSPILDRTRHVIDNMVLPQLSQAVWAVAQQVQINWIKGIQEAHLWAAEKDEYASSIDLKSTGPFSALVWSDYRYAVDIETGRPARDLKLMLNTSAKVRVSAKGRRYLIIPFRHNTPGHNAVGRAMPTMVYQQARQLTASRVSMGGTMRPSGLQASDVKTKGQMMVPAHQYRWGDRLPAGLAPKLQQRHKTDPYAGMVRFDARTPGGKRYSTYMTFRVMAENSPGWVVAPRPGLNIVKAVVDELTPKAEKAFARAVELVANEAAKP